MGQVSHEQANMMLRLYELRREARMREARDWFIHNFFPQSLSDRAALTPDQDASVRMVASYWDMVAGFVKRGLVDEDIFLETTSEFWIVWDRLKPISGAARQAAKDPHLWENLEKLAVRYENWRERHAPGSLAVMRERMQQMRAARFALR